jgi:hypothetical protein
MSTSRSCRLVIQKSTFCGDGQHRTAFPWSPVLSHAPGRTSALLVCRRTSVLSVSFAGTSHRFHERVTSLRLGNGAAGICKETANDLGAESTPKNAGEPSGPTAMVRRRTEMGGRERQDGSRQRLEVMLGQRRSCAAETYPVAFLRWGIVRRGDRRRTRPHRGAAIGMMRSAGRTGCRAVARHHVDRCAASSETSRPTFTAA